MPTYDEYQHGELLNNTYGVERRITIDEFSASYTPLKNDETLKNNKVNVAEYYSEKAHQNVYVAYSNPAEYVDKGENFKLVDLVVEGAFGESRESVLERFNAQVAFANEYREMSQEFARTEILPILTDLPNLNCVYGRGDIYDKERVPSADLEHSSDIDLMLFVDPLAEGDLENYVAVLEKYAVSHPEVVFTFHSYEVVNEKSRAGYGEDMRIISAPKKDEPIKNPILISIDVMPIDPLIQLAENASHDKLKKVLNPYAAHSITTGGEILWSSDGALGFDSDQITYNAKEKVELPKIIQLKNLVYKFVADKSILESGVTDLSSFDVSWVTKE